MEIKNHLNIGKFEFIQPIDLFNDLPLYAINENRCPGCGLKLYSNRQKTMRFCKSVKCPILLQTKRKFFTKK